MKVNLATVPSLWIWWQIPTWRRILAEQLSYARRFMLHGDLIHVLAHQFFMIVSVHNFSLLCDILVSITILVFASGLMCLVIHPTF